MACGLQGLGPMEVVEPCVVLVWLAAMLIVRGSLTVRWSRDDAELGVGAGMVELGQALALVTVLGPSSWGWEAWWACWAALVTVATVGATVAATVAATVRSVVTRGGSPCSGERLGRTLVLALWGSSLAGMPPSPGFVARSIVVVEAAGAGEGWLSWLVVLGTGLAWPGHRTAWARWLEEAVPSRRAIVVVTAGLIVAGWVAHELAQRLV